jgi:HK97 family phage major capsid protein
MKKKLLALLAKKNERKAAIIAQSEKCEDVAELKSLNVELDTLNAEIRDLQGMIDSIPDEPAPVTALSASAAGAGTAERTAAVNGEIPGVVVSSAKGEEKRAEKQDIAEKREAAEKRGKALKENRAVTVGSSNVVVPKHAAPDIRPTFNEVSSLIDGVDTKFLIGGESFQQPYVAGYGTGDYKAEGEEYATAEPIFGYTDINKAKVTAYAEDTEELQKLPDADYDGEVMKGIRIASRKKINREILVGTGATNRLTGIFSAAATAIDADTDLEIAEIDETTLDDIIFSYGGDEEVEDAAVLTLNKKDLAAFAKLRTADGKKIHDIKTNGNTGTIDGYPFVINSACNAISDEDTESGDYCMAYGPLSNYRLCIFSDMDVKRSEDYKFKQGMICHRGSIFLGGNVVSKNGFLRVKKS